MSTGSRAYGDETPCNATQILCSDLTGQHVFINVPFDQLRACLTKYKQQKLLAPATTSACILVPCRKHDHKLHKLVQHMQLLLEFPAGMKLFENVGAAEYHELGPCPYPIRIYSDGPQQVTTILNAITTGLKAPLAMLMKGVVNKQPARILLDSGATDSFISATFAAAMGLRIQEAQGSIETGDGNISTITGKLKAHVQIQQYKDRINLLVLEMSDAFDLVLGTDWLRANKVCLDFEAEQVYMKTNNRRITLHINEPRNTHNSSTHMLSALQTKKAIRKGVRKPIW